MEQYDFRGNVVLITGAGHGIGRGLADAFAGAGATVAAADLNLDRAQLVADEVRDAHGVETLALAMDVRSASSVEAAIALVVERFQTINILVNNAGIYPNSPLFDLTESEWDAVFDTNVKGIFLVTKAVAAVMAQRGQGGRIINISSGAAISARPGAAHYCSSKAAVNMLTKVLALELTPLGITVNAIAPGLIEVPDWGLADNYINAIVGTMPAGRIGQPADIARGALFLASPESSFITATILGIDGGSMAGRGLPLSRRE
jgi:3-oxoacyl-[acyl-carrier protein] reductase